MCKNVLFLIQINSICLSWLSVKQGLCLMERVSELKKQRLEHAGALKITLCEVCGRVTGVVHELAWK